MLLNKNNCPIGNMRYLEKKKKTKTKKAGDGERGIFKSVSKLHFQASLPISIN
jgi:hypothetical protein